MIQESSNSFGHRGGRNSEKNTWGDEKAYLENVDVVNWMQPQMQMKMLFIEGIREGIENGQKGEAEESDREESKVLKLLESPT